MLTYAVRRIAATLPVLVGATFLVYVLVSVANDPLARLATCTNCDQAAYDRIIDLYDLDQPIPVRFLGWIGSAVQGDLGISTSLGQQPVAPILFERAWNTALLAVPAFVLIAITAMVLSVISAVRQYSLADYLVTGGSFLGISMPTFFFGLLLQVAFGVWWQDWTGTKPFYVTGMHLDSWQDYVASATLPIATLALVIVATESRFGRASMLEVINADYIRMARSKGLSERKVVFVHALRNAMIPIVTLWALDFSALLGGSVITETIFAWPGLGQLLISSLTAQDLDLVMGVVMFIAVITVAFNLVADLLYGFLDPRVRYD
ncbi:MAG TPA: ABC transporter permease [Acidimicrobiia bacterium]|nr:ABC transporter permease [Acidimicrobiia bacterium]